jgi:hypothetical protein
MDGLVPQGSEDVAVARPFSSFRRSGSEKRTAAPYRSLVPLGWEVLHQGPNPEAGLAMYYARVFARSVPLSKSLVCSLGGFALRGIRVSSGNAPERIAECYAHRCTFCSSSAPAPVSGDHSRSTCVNNTTSATSDCDSRFNSIISRTNRHRNRDQGGTAHKTTTPPHSAK